jgi:phosphatidylethanolamine/phosphatidyl-N-methylethanolamine N-methyltransferase
MSNATVRKIYNRYASFYDFLFGFIFKQGRAVCVEKVNKLAEEKAQILEIGIGTGLSLPLYRSDLSITGIDISEKMLQKAEKQRDKHQLNNRVILKVMDAEHLEFPANHFDFIVAMYVASVVPDVKAFLHELIRVAKPTAHIIFVNHFASKNSVVHFFEEKLAHINDWVGFKSDFSMDLILEDKHLILLDTCKVNLFGYWKLLHCKIEK